MSVFTEFLIIGYQDREEPQILEYYNSVNNESEIPYYLQNISIMCFTTNELTCQTQDINNKNYIHQFIITDKQGILRYCTSLIVYESIKGDMNIPYAYVIVSLDKSLQRQKSFMRAIYYGIFDRVTRYRDRGWDLCQQKLSNQQLLEFYISTGISKLTGLYYLPKQVMINRQEVITDLIINNPQKKHNLFNQDISFKLLIQKLSINSIIKIVQSIILEKQIILFTSNVSDLASITEALLQFIYPLQWRCIYIPYLPPQMLDTLHVSVPYIIGVYSNLKEKVLTSFDCLDKVLIDLDQDRVIGTNLIFPFPEQLVEQLTLQCQKYNLYSNLINIQSCFLQFFLQLINNILPFFVYSKNNYSQIEEIFDKDLYLNQFTPIDQEFYREFVNKTMMFPRFIEESYQYLQQTQFLKQNSNKQNLFLELLLNSNCQYYFNVYKSQIFDTKIYQLITEETQYNSEQERSIHSLFTQYIKIIKEDNILQKHFPILSLDKNKIVQIIPEYSSVKLQHSTQSQKTDICNENKQNILITTIQPCRIQKYYLSAILQNDEKNIIIKYPKKSLGKLKKTLADQLLKLQPDPLPPTPQISIRQSRRIFNTDEAGYVSLYRTKTYNTLSRN